MRSIISTGKAKLMTAVIILSGFTATSQTMIPLPSHSSTYTGYTRGLYFTVPIDMEIVGLRVPDDASSADQAIEILEFPSAPPTSGQGTQLGYWTGITGNTIVSTNISVEAGDVIGVLGNRYVTTGNFDAINSYGSGQTVMVDGNPVTLNRFGYQDNIAAAPSNGTNLITGTSGNIGRVEIYWRHPYNAPDDAGVASIDAPLSGCAGAHDVVVTVENFGTNILNNVVVNWEVGGNLQPPVQLSVPIDTLNGSGPNTAQVTLGSYDFQDPNDADIRAWTTDPNGVPDTVNTNDTATTTVDINFTVIQEVSVTDLSCAGGSDGQATVTSLGGIPPFSYYWSHGDTGASVSSIPEGTHNVILIDSAGCRDTTEITVEAPPEIEVELVKGGSTCKGATNGYAEVEASGGVLPYTYSWSEGTQRKVINNVPAGTYTVIVTDDNGCQVNKEIEIVSAPILRSTVDSTAPAYCSDNMGYASVSATGGIPPYTYEWTGGHTGPQVSNLPGGDYRVTVIDSTGCENAMNVKIPDLDLEVFVDRPTLKARFEEGIYSWYDCDAGTIVSEDSIAYTAENPGYYALILTYQNCTDTSGCHYISYTNIAEAARSADAFDVYPNPSQGAFNVRLTGDLSDVKIEMLDMKGKMIYSRRVAETTSEHIEEFNGEHLSPGLYLIKVTRDNNAIVKKVVVN